MTYYYLPQASRVVEAKLHVASTDIWLEFGRERSAFGAHRSVDISPVDFQCIAFSSFAWRILWASTNYYYLSIDSMLAAVSYRNVKHAAECPSITGQVSIAWVVSVIWPRISIRVYRAEVRSKMWIKTSGFQILCWVWKQFFFQLKATLLKILKLSMSSWYQTITVKRSHCNPQLIFGSGPFYGFSDDLETFEGRKLARTGGRAWAWVEFFPEGKIVDFSRWWPKAFFQGKPTMMKFHFTNSETKRKTYLY